MEEWPKTGLGTLIATPFPPDDARMFRQHATSRP